jgi:hypothetical protein
VGGQLGNLTGATAMPVSEERELTPEEMETGPKPNGDLGSWLYVLCGVPCMILFFLLFFGSIGTCDGVNIMIPG